MTRSILSTALVALICLGIAPAQEEGKPRTHTFSGELKKVESDSLTVTSRGDKGEVTQTFKTGPKTKVLVETDKDVEVTGADGKVLKRPARQEVKLSELRLGERVVVTHTEDKKASQVVQPRSPVKPPVKKPPKEGDR
jgi:maltose-binding protein MalE